MNIQKLEAYASQCLGNNQPMQLLIEMSDFSAPELQVNPPENIEKKLEYIKNTYDENCEHKHAKGIRIVDVVYTTEESMPLVGQIRYNQSSYVGEVSNDLNIEGGVDDVLKVLEATHSKKLIPNITINLAHDMQVDEVVNTIKKEMERHLGSCL